LVVGYYAVSKFVSRAGEKLEFALGSFGISVKGKVCADFGSSTGGFVDCLLQNGAKKVYSVDTAYGELAWKLRRDPRVVVLERTNAMHVILPEKMDLITIDTSWTLQSKVLPNAIRQLKKAGVLISLIKPHYEAGKAKLTDEEVGQVVDATLEEISSLGLKVWVPVESP
jgi:23S rRNA (cytidine1920-2'-O)/16S rRNA (cytidine1409-2'-O)-methyltransferase